MIELLLGLPGKVKDINQTVNVGFAEIDTDLTALSDQMCILETTITQYIDAAIAGLDAKASVRAASTTNVVMFGEQIVDGVLLVTGDRILLKDQTDGRENGLYNVSLSAWTRTEDANNDPHNEVSGGMYTFVENGGLINGNSGWVMNSPSGEADLGVDILSFVKFSNVTAPVQSVNGEDGVVVLTPTHLGLGQVDNTSDLDKPVSDDTQVALDLKLDITGTAYNSDRLGGIDSSQYLRSDIDDVYGDSGSLATTLEFLNYSVADYGYANHGNPPIMSMGSAVGDAGIGFDIGRFEPRAIGLDAQTDVFYVTPSVAEANARGVGRGSHFKLHHDGNTPPLLYPPGEFGTADFGLVGKGTNSQWPGITFGQEVAIMYNTSWNDGVVSIYDDIGNHDLARFHVNGAVFLFYNGSARLSTTSSGIHVTGEIRASGDIIAYYSDERLKDISGPIENALDKIDTWRPIHYTANYTAEKLGYDTSKKEIGLIAQDIEKDFPELVADAPINEEVGCDYKTLKYDRIVSVLVAGIQELRQEVNDLKKQLDAK